MMMKILPILLALVGTGVGVGAGLVLRPDPEIVPIEAALEKPKQAEKKDKADKGAEGHDYVKMSNQFVVPIVDREAVRALVVMALSIEVEAGNREAIFLHEPKLRDSFLQVMFEHANLGGFEGEFTAAAAMRPLRQALREVAQRDMGEIVTDVLISDIARQDY